MIDTHDLLVPLESASFPAALKLSEARQQALLAQLVAPPCTEAELLQLADTSWKDP